VLVADGPEGAMVMVVKAEVVKPREPVVVVAAGEKGKSVSVPEPPSAGLLLLLTEPVGVNGG